MVRNALKPMLRRMREQAKRAAQFETRLEELNRELRWEAEQNRHTPYLGGTSQKGRH